MKKRMVAMLLSLVMTVSLLPLDGYAAAANTGDRITEESVLNLEEIQTDINGIVETEVQTDVEESDLNSFPETERATETEIEPVSTEVVTEEAQTESNIQDTQDDDLQENHLESNAKNEKTDAPIDNKNMEADIADQSGVTPIVLNPERETDNLEQLSAGAAARNARVTILDYGFPKYFWVNNFGEDPEQDYLEWTVQSTQEETQSYYIWLHLDAVQGSNFKLEVTQGSETTVTNYTKAQNGWEVTEFGEIQIPSGISRIKFTKVSTDKKACGIKGMDMIRSSDKDAYEQRVSQYLGDGGQAKLKFSESGYGLFFQYGVWGYPQFGDKKDKESATDDFDVESFVDTVETTGSKFIIWSLTWWQYRMQMPLSSVDEILGHDKFTTKRNLVGEIAAECKSRGIDFYLYYHQGLQQEQEWKVQQDFPTDFSKTGTGNKDLFFENWIRVISEVGENLGGNLDGWFFDDGCVYYPAPFEALGKATKAGNSNRVVSYNSWHGTAVTKFQDMIFGEGTWGSPSDTVDGIYQSGKEEGLLQVGMPMINNLNWGITSANETIVPQVSAATAINNVKSAKARKVPIALNIKMWEDGRIGEGNTQLLFDIRDGLSGKIPKDMINNNDSEIKYSSDWKYGEKYSGSYNSDVHYSKSVSEKPSVEYTFQGTGIGVIGRGESWACNIKVFIDGEEDTRNAWTFKSTTDVKQLEAYKITGLEDTSHTIRVEYSDGAEAQFDAFRLYFDEVEKPTYPVKSITVGNSGGTGVVGIGETCQLSANVKPEYATNKEVKWSVTDEEGAPTELASVDEQGLLTVGNELGKIKVTATSAADAGIVGSKVFSIKVMPLRTTIYGNSEEIKRVGTWTLRAGTKSCDSNIQDNTASMTFEGDYIEWYGVIANDHGIANVYIDDVYITNVDCYSTGRKVDTLLFRSNRLGEGSHTIKVEVQELKNQDSSSRYMEIYRFVTEKDMKFDTQVTLNDKTVVYTGTPIEMTGAETTPEGLEVHYQYRKQGTEEWGTNAPVDVGTYEVKGIFAGNEEYNPSEAQALLAIDKFAYTEKTSTPSVNDVSITENQVNLNPIHVENEVVEYAVNTKNEEPDESKWQDATLFTSLTKGTEYYFFARVKGNAIHTVGPVSDVLKVTTKKNTFIPVTNITEVPAEMTVGEQLTLTGKVAPANATNKTIVWSVKDAGTTGGEISGNVLKVKTEGTVTITATVTKGLTASSNYTEDFSVAVTHSWSTEWSKDATKHWYACTCGEKKDEASHTTSEWIIDKAATTTAVGSKHQECTICKAVLKTQGIPKVNITLTGIKVTTVPTTIRYVQGSALSVSGGKLTATYSNGTKKTISLTTSMVSGYNKNKVGSQKLTVTYQKKKVTFTVTVTAPKVTQITWVKKPTKVQYVKGNTLSVTGGKLKVTYENKTTKTVNLTTSMVSAYNKNKPGTQKLTVTYGGKKISYTITMKVPAKWVKTSKGWRYQQSTGMFVTNKWFENGGKRYHFDTKGYMQTGWLQLGSKWYYLYESGAMAENTYIGIHRIGSDGVWIEKM